MVRPINLERNLAVDGSEGVIDKSGIPEEVPIRELVHKHLCLFQTEHFAEQIHEDVFRHTALSGAFHTAR